MNIRSSEGKTKVPSMWLWHFANTGGKLSKTIYLFYLQTLQTFCSLTLNFTNLPSWDAFSLNFNNSSALVCPPTRKMLCPSSIYNCVDFSFSAIKSWQAFRGIRPSSWNLWASSMSILLLLCKASTKTDVNKPNALSISSIAFCVLVFTCKRHKSTLLIAQHGTKDQCNYLGINCCTYLLFSNFNWLYKIFQFRSIFFSCI